MFERRQASERARRGVRVLLGGLMPLWLGAMWGCNAASPAVDVTKTDASVVTNTQESAEKLAREAGAAAGRSRGGARDGGALSLREAGSAERNVKYSDAGSDAAAVRASTIDATSQVVQEAGVSEVVSGRVLVDAAGISSGEWDSGQRDAGVLLLDSAEPEVLLVVPNDPAAASLEPELVNETGLWQTLFELEAAALLSVHGRSATDVWVVGADDGEGPVVLHWNGRRWERLMTELTGVDLWWVQALDDGSVIMGGSGGTVLRYERRRFERLRFSSTGRDQVWGVWGASRSDIYAVGSTGGRNGFIWHFDGDDWSELTPLDPLPINEEGTAPGLFKVWGASARDVWIVGGQGVVLRGNATDGFSRLESGIDAQLVGLHGTQERVWTLGGGASGVLLEWDAAGQPTELTPPGAPLIQGVAVQRVGFAWVVGLGGTIYRLFEGHWQVIESGLDQWPETLHSAWADPEGGVWAVGGNIFSRMNGGVLLHRGPAL